MAKHIIGTQPDVKTLTTKRTIEQLQVDLLRRLTEQGERRERNDQLLLTGTSRSANPTQQANTTVALSRAFEPLQNAIQSMRIVAQQRPADASLATARRLEQGAFNAPEFQPIAGPQEIPAFDVTGKAHQITPPPSEEMPAFEPIPVKPPESRTPPEATQQPEATSEPQPSLSPDDPLLPLKKMRHANIDATSLAADAANAKREAAKRLRPTTETIGFREELPELEEVARARRPADTVPVQPAVQRTNKEPEQFPDLVPLNKQGTFDVLPPVQRESIPLAEDAPEKAPAEDREVFNLLPETMSPIAETVKRIADKMDTQSTAQARKTAGQRTTRQRSERESVANRRVGRIAEVAPPHKQPGLHAAREAFNQVRKGKQQGGILGAARQAARLLLGSRRQRKGGSLPGQQGIPVTPSNTSNNSGGSPFGGIGSVLTSLASSAAPASSALATLATTAGPAGAAIGAVAGLATSGFSALKDATLSVVSTFQNVANTARGFTQALNPSAVLVFDMTMRDLTATIGVAMQPLLNASTQIARSFANTLYPVMQRLAPVMTQVSQSVASVVEGGFKVFGRLAEAVQPVISALGEFITSLEPIGTAFMDVTRMVVTTLSPALTLLGESIKLITMPVQALGAAIELVRPGFEVVSVTFSGIAETLHTAFSGLADTIRSFWGGTGMDGAFKGLRESLMQLAKASLLATANIAKFFGADSFVQGMIKGLSGPRREDTTGLGAAKNATSSSLLEFNRRLMTESLLASPQGLEKKEDPTDRLRMELVRELQDVQANSKDFQRWIKEDLPKAIASAIREAPLNIAKDTAKSIWRSIGGTTTEAFKGSWSPFAG